MPDVRRKENNDLSICFVLELKRIMHSATRLCVTMQTRPLFLVSFENLISKTAWIEKRFCTKKINQTLLKIN